MQIKARVRDELLTECPRDLYIPPHALEVFLDQFEGPLDLLLYLIKRDRLNILDIPIRQITDQYIQYIAALDRSRFELAAEYLLMASILIDIKTRLLLPVPPQQDLAGQTEEVDPRQELMRRLEVYASFKDAAERLDARPRLYRELWPAYVTHDPFEQWVALPQPTPADLTHTLKRLLKRMQALKSHVIEGLTWSVGHQMEWMAVHLKMGEVKWFTQLILRLHGRLGCVVAFVALLEWCRSHVLKVEQEEPFAQIQVEKIAEPEMAIGDER